MDNWDFSWRLISYSPVIFLYINVLLVDMSGYIFFFMDAFNLKKIKWSCNLKSFLAYKKAKCLNALVGLRIFFLFERYLSACFDFCYTLVSCTSAFRCGKLNCWAIIDLCRSSCSEHISFCWGYLFSYQRPLRWQR